MRSSSVSSEPWYFLAIETTRRRFALIMRSLAARSPRSIRFASSISSSGVSSRWRPISLRKSCSVSVVTVASAASSTGAATASSARRSRRAGRSRAPRAARRGCRGRLLRARAPARARPPRRDRGSPASSPLSIKAAIAPPEASLAVAIPLIDSPERRVMKRPDRSRGRLVAGRRAGILQIKTIKGEPSMFERFKRDPTSRTAPHAAHERTPTAARPSPTVRGARAPVGDEAAATTADRRQRAPARPRGAAPTRRDMAPPAPASARSSAASTGARPSSAGSSPSASARCSSAILAAAGAAVGLTERHDDRRAGATRETIGLGGGDRPARRADDRLLLRRLRRRPDVALRRRAPGLRRLAVRDRRHDRARARRP